MNKKPSRRQVVGITAATAIGGLAASSKSFAFAPPDKTKPSSQLNRGAVTTTAAEAESDLKVIPSTDYTLWTHGHALTINYNGGSSFNGEHDSVTLPNNAAARVKRPGWGAEISMGRTDNENLDTDETFWINYAAPTPSLHNGRAVRAQEIIIRGLGSATPGVTLDRVYLWDGPNLFYENNSFQNAWPQGYMRDLFESHTVNFGIGVSLRVRGASAKWDHKLAIHAVGVRFNS